MGLIAMMRVPLAPSVLCVIRQNQEGGGPMVNTPEWRAWQAVSQRLRVFREALRSDPEAVL